MATSVTGYNELRYKAERWCFKNDVLISADGIPGSTNCRIVAVVKGKIHMGEKIYKQKNVKDKDPKWWEAINELRIYYYQKYCKDE